MRRALLLVGALALAGCTGTSHPASSRPLVRSSSAEAEASAQQAVADAYATWVQGQIVEEARATTVLTAAVRRGDLAAARRAYPGARVNYERIEPVAETLGELDASLDARVADVPSAARWTGYHRLERALFKDDDLTGMVRIADLLDADVAQLSTLAGHLSFTAPDLARGAGELLNEIGKTKITGEEEAYSHLDLVDFQANLDGADKAFDLLAPVLSPRDPSLVATIRTRFQDVHARLARHRTDATATGFASYTTVVPAERRTLSDLVDALAEPLSKTSGLLVIS